MRGPPPPPPRRAPPPLVPCAAGRRRRPGAPPRGVTWCGGRGLVLAGHSGAAFDAWSTHRAVAGGYGQEANPFLRPFANSNAIYAATQVSPAVMDYLGKRMMVSQNRWIRKMWW